MSEGHDDGSRLWHRLRSTLFGGGEPSTLRTRIAKAIAASDESEQNPGGDDLSAVERQMVSNLLTFGERTVGDVAVPRADIIAVPETIGFDALVSTFAEAGHSRVPVYRENLDDVIGMVHIKDLFAILAHDTPRPTDLTSLLRNPLYVPGSMGVLDLLAEMRSQRVHLAIVIDEYSGTDGLITIEDLMEEIVGDIADEHDDEPEPMLTRNADGGWNADARAELEDVAAMVDPRLGEADGDVDTLGGLAFLLAGHVPQPGESAIHPSGWRLEIVEGDARRAVRLILHPPAEREGAPTPPP